MVEHIQTEPTNCLSLFDHFVGLALKGLLNNMEATFPIDNANRLRMTRTLINYISYGISKTTCLLHQS